jgi:hypothetical protein
MQLPPPLPTFGSISTMPMPPQQQDENSFHQSALISALHVLSIAPNGAWVANSGALAHMTANHGNLLHSTPADHLPSVIVGNGSSIPITHRGTSSLFSPSRTFHLNDVLVTPNIVKDLLSVRRFTTDNSLSMEFDPFGVSVKDLATKEVLLRCSSSDDLYPIFAPASPHQALPALSITMDLWHCRLGHPGVSLVFNKSFPCNNVDHLCHAC